jgi:predicted Rossmann fold flavoprotein
MLIIIGGGPAGYFGAIRARALAPAQTVVLLEKSGQVLRKVAVSGGGRCNVTHACDDPAELAARYPRGGRELRGPFHAFGPAQTVAWFAARGVELKTEADGRMFPVTDSSATIVNCLRETAHISGVEVRTRLGAAALMARSDGGLTVALTDGSLLDADAVLLASGGQTSGGLGGYDMAAGLGHTIVPPVPSLFTFKIDNPVLADLAGVAVPRAEVKVSGAKRLSETGPVLVTHWGLSGPAVLRLSALGARHLHDCGYTCEIAVNWCPDLSAAQVDERLQHETRANGRQQIGGSGPFGLPRRLWQSLASAAGIADDLRWADLGRGPRQALAQRVSQSTFRVSGQATNKEEFVTCGGVALKEVDFRTMASRVCPGLYLAGEVLDIDGITGGFNFQSCWTTGWLAGGAMAERYTAGVSA